MFVLMLVVCPIMTFFDLKQVPCRFMLLLFFCLCFYVVASRNLHESIKAGWDRTSNPWICSQICICSQTRYQLRFVVSLFYICPKATRGDSPVLQHFYYIYKFHIKNFNCKCVQLVIHGGCRSV